MSREDIARIIFPENERVRVDAANAGNRAVSRKRWQAALEKADRIIAMMEARK